MLGVISIFIYLIHVSFSKYKQTGAYLKYKSKQFFTDIKYTLKVFITKIVPRGLQMMLGTMKIKLIKQIDMNKNFHSVNVKKSAYNTAYSTVLNK